MNALRVLLWTSSACGVFVAFGWPFVVSDDPAATALRWFGMGTFAAFLVLLAIAACATALRGDRRRG
jgi:hypothetical protein